MITAEVRVNGALISYLHIVNKGHIHGEDAGGIHRYQCEYYEQGKGVKSERIFHGRSDGAAALLAKALTSFAE